MLIRPPRSRTEYYLFGHKVEEIIYGRLLAYLPEKRGYKVEKHTFGRYDFIITDPNGEKYTVELKSSWSKKPTWILNAARKRNPDIVIIFDGREGKAWILINNRLYLLSKRWIHKAMWEVRRRRISQTKQ
jgi:DNA-binding sugar fermentation-stimulating protein